jgi:hypothetical protein
MTISKSPERMTFQAAGYKRTVEDPESTEEQKKSAQAMVDRWKQWREDAIVKEKSDDWKQNNLEYDLRTTDWILDKARTSETYAQNIYAALCNNEFQKLEVLPILKEESWSCSWRHAGGIVADMRVQGDYIDWYCSGMGDGLGNGDPDGVKGYVPESVVTDEIKEDLKRLGWVVLDKEEE